MAALLLKHLAGCFTRQLSQVTWSAAKSSSHPLSVCRSLSTLSAAPGRLVASSPIGLRLAGSSAPLGTTLLGQCQSLACFQPCTGMKTKTALKKRCKDCFIVRRRGHLFVFCKTNPRHKQRQG